MGDFFFRDFSFSWEGCLERGLRVVQFCFFRMYIEIDFVFCFGLIIFQWKYKLGEGGIFLVLCMEQVI